MYKMNLNVLILFIIYIDLYIFYIILLFTNPCETYHFVPVFYHHIASYTTSQRSYKIRIGLEGF